MICQSARTKIPIFFKFLPIVVLVSLAVSGSAFNASGAQREARARLYADLEASPILQNKLVPLSHDSPIEVNIMLNVYKILEVVETQQHIKMAVYYEFMWKDEGFTWNPADYANVTFMYIPYDRAWHPEPIVLNSAVENFNMFPKPDYLRLRADGVFVITGGTIVHTHCYVDLTFFPFDHQTCTLILGLVGQDIVITPKASKTDLIEGMHQHVAIPAEWQVTRHNLTVPAVQELPQVLYTVHLDRASLYYLLCILGPMAATSQLTLLVFWIPPTSGERISFLMSIYVSATLYLGFVGDTLPRKSYSFVEAPRMVLFMVFSVIECVLVLIATIISMHLHTAEQRANQRAWEKENSETGRQIESNKDRKKSFWRHQDFNFEDLKHCQRSIVKLEEGDMDVDLTTFLHLARVYFEENKLRPQKEEQNIQVDNEKDEVETENVAFCGAESRKRKLLQMLVRSMNLGNKSKKRCRFCAQTFDTLLFIIFAACSAVFYLRIFSGSN